MVLRRINVPLLPLLCSTRQQDHDRVAISPKINPEARPEIDSVFQHAFSDALHVGEIALLDAGYCAGHLCTG
jgi:hypothetical protein